MLNKLKKIVKNKLKKPSKLEEVSLIIEKYSKDDVEFEIPANAQYNPRIPDLVNGVVPS